MCSNVRVLRCAVQLVRLVVGADRDRAAGGEKSGSTEAIWPLKIAVVARLLAGRHLDLELRPELERVGVDLVALLVRDPDRAPRRAASGESTTLTSCRSSRNIAAIGMPSTGTSIAATWCLTLAEGISRRGSATTGNSRGGGAAGYRRRWPRRSGAAGGIAVRAEGDRGERVAVLDAVHAEAGLRAGGRVLALGRLAGLGEAELHVGAERRASGLNSL